MQTAVWRRLGGWTGVGMMALALLTPALSGSAQADFAYIDGSFGLAITFPDGTAVTRTTSPAGETGTEISQFTLPGGNTVGRLVVSDLPVDWTLAKATDLVRSQFAQDAKVKPSQITSGTVKVKGEYKSATLLQAWDAAGKQHNAILIVQGPSDQMFILYIATRKTSRADGQKIALQHRAELRGAAACRR